MSRSLPALCCLFALTGLALAWEPVELIAADSRQVVFELSLDSVTVVTDSAGVALLAPGWYSLDEPGELDIPCRDVLVGIPPGARPVLAARPLLTETMADVRLRRIPAFVERTADQPKPLTAESRTPPLAEIVAEQRFRDIRVARVRVRAARPNLPAKGIELLRRLQVTVSFRGGERAPQSANTGSAPALDSALAQMLVNGNQALGWKLAPSDQDSVNFFSRSAVWVKVEIETTGIYQIRPGDLRELGLDPDAIDPATLRLYGLGRHIENGPYGDTIAEVAILVSDNGNNRFDGSDYLAFYAESPSYWQRADSLWGTNPFTTRACFWLTWGTGPGRRMAEVSGGGATSPRTTAFRRVRLERDELCPARSGLLWLWQYFYKASGPIPVDTAVVLDLPERDTILRIAGRLIGRYSGDVSVPYPLILSLNGFVLDTVTVTARAQTPPPCDFAFDSLPLLVAARPNLTDSLGFLLYPEREEELFLDYLEVDYIARLRLTRDRPFIEFSVRDSGGADFEISGAPENTVVVDATDPIAPKLIRLGTKTSRGLALRLVPSAVPARIACALPDHLRRPVLSRQQPGTLRSPSVAADYCIICPDEFYDAAVILARYRENNVPGLPMARAQAFRLSEIYNDYAFGWEEPGAIKAFLRAKRPQYVLLAGDGTYDYRNILGLRTNPTLPPYETGIDIDPEVYGRTAKALDAWYADLDGAGSSPDLILGRITCRSAVELRLFLEKVREYESQPPGYWAKRFILLADDEYLGTVTRRDPIGFQHIFGSEAMATRATPLLDPVKIYLTEWPPGDRGRSELALRNELDRGALLWCFYGHGAGFQLNHEKTLEIAKVRNIRNGRRLPLAFFGSCGVGRFDDTRFEAIAEELVRFDQGCIATIGATKATESGGNEYLAGILFPCLMNNPSLPIGPAFYSAYTQANTLYHLFGDPATRLRMPVLGPGPIALPDTFYPGARITASCSVSAQSGWFGLAAHEANWLRNYRSDNGQQVNYVLPGYRLTELRGRFDSGLVLAEFVVPRISYPETTATGDGFYVRRPNSSRISTLTGNGDSIWSGLRGTIPFSRDTAPKTDNTPPQLRLFADRIRLVPNDTTRVPVGFELIGEASDPSGILLVPIPDLMLSLTFAGTRTDLTPYFSYDQNSSTTGRFTYPIRLTRAVDSLTVVVSDNMVDPSSPGRNRTTQTVWLSTDLADVLRLDSCLVYPNPGQGPTHFTFWLSRSAQVSLRIYTLSGRLVRSIPASLRPFGFNSIYWDGRDGNGTPLPNGVYLYRLSATARTASSTQSAGYTDKLIIYR